MKINLAKHCTDKYYIVGNVKQWTQLGLQCNFLQLIPDMSHILWGKNSPYDPGKPIRPERGRKGTADVRVELWNNKT